MLTIYTHSNSPLTKEFWKWCLRKLVGKKSGPDAVRDSLLRGLKESGIEHRLDPLIHYGETALVLSGVNALKKAIVLKKKGVFKKLIAGPNIISLPSHYNSIITNPSIDKVLVPSEWVRDLWIQKAPELESRLVVFPSGTRIHGSSTRNGEIIIYDKLNDETVATDIQTNLNELGYKTRVLKYGRFKQSDYFESLKSAVVVIYLGSSESQGLALQEAWAHDVPTIVKRVTEVITTDFNWEEPKLAAPYLTNELGFFFDSTDELPNLIEKVKTLHPKEYCDQNLSDKATVAVLSSYL